MAISRGQSRTPFELCRGEPSTAKRTHHTQGYIVLRTALSLHRQHSADSSFKRWNYRYSRRGSPDEKELIVYLVD